MDSGVSIAMSGGAVLAWVAVLYKGFSLWRQPRNAAAQVYWAGFFALAINLTIIPPSVAGAIDRVIGLPNISYLLADVAALLACWAWLVSLRILSLPGAILTRQVRWLGWTVVGAIAFMCARFVVAPDQTLHRFGPSLADIYLAIYRLLFVAIIGLHMLWFVVLLRRYAVTVPASPLRLRLRLMTAAACAILGFVAASVLWICRMPVPEIASAFFLFLGIALVVCSLTLAKPLYSLWQWLVFQRHFRQLYPLWAALYPVKPGQSLLPPPSYWRHWLPQRDIRFRVYRQVIEILDWMLLLRPYQLADSTLHSKDLTPHTESDPSASVEPSRAATLADALRNWYRAQHSGNHQHKADRFVPAFIDGDAPPRAVDWTSELYQLIEIARHFRDSPLDRTPVNSFGPESA